MVSSYADKCALNADFYATGTINANEDCGECRT